MQYIYWGLLFAIGIMFGLLIREQIGKKNKAKAVSVSGNKDTKKKRKK